MPGMGRRKTSPGQIALPLGQQDQALSQRAEEEAQRTVASATRELRAADLISTVTGMSYAEAEQVLKQAGGVHRLAQMPDYALTALPFIDPVRARKIRALTDWGTVLRGPEVWQSVQVRSPVDVADLLMLEMGLLEQEHLRTVLLDTKNHVMLTPTVYAGNVNSIMVRVSEVFREAIRANSPCLILAHNHPSGDPTPSPVIWRKSQVLAEGIAG